MTQVAPKIEPSWLLRLGSEFEKPYFDSIKKVLTQEREAGAKIYPPGSKIFNAFNLTPFDEVKVVIIGQDPYHGPDQAHGLCFSVPEGIAQPPSLKNIFKELEQDLGIPPPDQGDLTGWASQGVFLLNAILSVRASEPASHRNIGWEQFTDQAIRCLSDERYGLVFMLWGRFAKEKADLIDTNKHYILAAAHPSPFSAASGFFGCKHFSRANELLAHEGYNGIDWARL